jgi:protein FAM32A
LHTETDALRDPFWQSRKKKKSRSSTSHDVSKGGSSSSNSNTAREKERLLLESGEQEGEPTLDSIEGNEKDNGARPGRVMTEAELKFEKMRKKRLEERVLKQAKLSHKDRVDAFNRDLENRTEHFAMGRVGGGG